MTETAEPPRRARSLAEMQQIQGRMGGRHDFPNAIKDYRPRPTDIVISPYGKCGTTWLQQTFHTLRTGGDMDFDDISRVTPWIETSRLLGLDLEAPQRGEPRGFKSHLGWEQMPKGAKYVVSFRDPKDALVSMYRFMEGWWLEPGAVAIDAFAQDRIAKADEPMSYWRHLLGWWGQRDNPHVLLFTYERMTEAPEETIRRLAAFAGLPLDEMLLQLTLERSSLPFMLAHKDKFDDLMMRQLSEDRGGLPSGSDSAKVRKGGVGGYRAELSEATVVALDDVWRRIVTPATGFDSYAALEAAVRRLAAPATAK